MAEKALQLPQIDLSSPDRASSARTIRQVCLDHGFFYLINHGVDGDFINKSVFGESRKFFSLPLQEKMKLALNGGHKGYTALYDETLDTSIKSKGDFKESFYVGPPEGSTPQNFPNQWPPKDVLPSWRATMETYREKLQTASQNLLSLIALALNLDEDFFEKVGAYPPSATLRLIHYPGELSASESETYGASAHSDYGMITLLVTDGVPGLQICREKDKRPRVWEDVPHVNGAFIVNIGDLMERWTNCLFRSTLHRVMLVGQNRYSVAFFVDPKPDCVVECLENCCSETSPPRFPPIRAGDYLHERLRVTYAKE
ncbi:2-oxoglutarate-Fe(II) type oxidoreductase hxnY-like [Aristolochia californica]|uniref:2-oxoglutarate-Fe(II) type oxidoreductase hxnY-like n=1 Tax=Aristolochia californica TaxID=171875 RepID=UPI0035D53C63